MKIWNKKILNKAVTFLLMAVLLCWNAVQVEAYTALDGYPFVLDDGMTFDFATDGVRHYFTDITPSDTNTYFFDLGDNVYRGFSDLSFGSFEEGYTFPFQPDLYDYYLVGTFYASGYIEYSFEPTVMYVIYNYGNGPYEEHLEILSDVNFYRYANSNREGLSFSGKLSLSGNSNVSRFLFATPNNNTVLSGDVYFSASIIPVEKDAAQSEANATILQKLIEINQNLVTSNSLQQSTIDAINQHDANEKSWFQQLIQNMGLGFSALYKQMTEEKDEQLYGYQDTTTSEAASAFSSESDKLTALEGELSTQSNTYVTDYAAEGFDLGVLATLGSSLIFVTTWFTNFWNMGGVFTACLNFCFALSIVFFILRIKR